MLYCILEIISSFVNLVWSLFNHRPNISFGVDYLAYLEVRRINKEMESHYDSKEAELSKANKLKQEARDLLDVGN
jgi:hypothetical protein